ncbi:hypothetical protein ACJRO7_003206 [Eucalyptus globulus]|uniref:Uncharacterized protein n=1 Tax=Eucalyptus globulus TaxID=34317 RepID=A0ABD3IVR5_EUCGL
MALRSASLCMILLVMALVSGTQADSHEGHSPAPSPHMHNHKLAASPIVQSPAPSTHLPAPALGGSSAAAAAFTPSFLGTASFACLAALLPIMLSSYGY